MAAAKGRPKAPPARKAPPKAATPKKAATPELPKILFEGDLPAPPAISGPGRRYALGPSALATQPELLGEAGELPEAYGTRRLFLAARDPHWLYAHWDFTTDQLRSANAASADRHLVLRIYVGAVEAAPCSEVHVHPESRNWFVHVGRGATRYVSELGYYRKPDRRWVRVAVSESTFTPPDALGPEAPVEFATIPLEVPFQTLVELVRRAALENVPLAEAILQLQASGYAALPAAEQWLQTAWTPEQERILAEVIGRSVSMDSVRRVWIGSLEITELLRRHLAEGAESMAAAAFSRPGVLPSGLGSISSPYGGAEVRRGFWFNINAELIIYGATEPDAAVTLAGRSIRLRPDGSFSFRFALPDGVFELPATATSADGEDHRVAELQFTRATTYRGDVGTHPQDSALKPPAPENVS